MTRRDEIADAVDLLRPPPARDLPAGRLEQRRQLLLEAIATPESAPAESRRRLQARLRRFVGWLAALTAIVASGLGAAHSTVSAPPLHEQQVIAAAAIGAATVVSLNAAGSFRNRSLDYSSTRNFVSALALGHVPAPL